MTDTATPHARAEHYAHPLFTHPDGEQCIWPDDSGWFVPYDVGGEGADCCKWHPGDDERRTLSALRRIVTTDETIEPRDTETREFLAAALRAAQTGSAGHWPTVAAVLADEVTRLRAALDTITTTISNVTER